MHFKTMGRWSWQGKRYISLAFPAVVPFPLRASSLEPKFSHVAKADCCCEARRLSKYSLKMLGCTLATMYLSISYVLSTKVSLLELSGLDSLDLVRLALVL